MRDDLVQVEGYIQSVTTLVDGGCKLSISTPELPPTTLSTLFGQLRKSGWFVFKPSKLEAVDIPDEQVDFKAGQKSRSQRLRAVLAVYWDQKVNHAKYPSADSFYDWWMDNKIADVKQELEP